jgi:predicted ATPase
MPEKLIIRNFGPIVNVELILRKVNILIGDQGTGKSTIGKLLLVLKTIASNNEKSQYISEKGLSDREFLVDEFISKRLKENFYKELESSELKNYLNFDSYIHFTSESCNILVEKNIITLDPNIKSEGKNTNINYFIPAYREAYILLRNNYPALLNSKAILPSILNTFGQLFNNFRESIKSFDFNDIMGVKYDYKNGSDVITLNNGKEITFEESSSAVNSVTPMLVVFEGIINLISQSKDRVYFHHYCPFISIEEPELNCYPSTQKKLIEYLIGHIKFPDYEKSNEVFCNLLITTHSPYILTSLNNLMYAYQVGKQYEDETVKIVPKRFWINPDDVSAYRLTNGVQENILDSNNENLIKAEKIDEVSEILNKQFDSLLNLEFVNK